MLPTLKHAARACLAPYTGAASCCMLGAPRKHAEGPVSQAVALISVHTCAGTWAACWDPPPGRAPTPPRCPSPSSSTPVIPYWRTTASSRSSTASTSSAASRTARIRVSLPAGAAQQTKQKTRSYKGPQSEQARHVARHQTQMLPAPITLGNKRVASPGF